MWLNDGGCEEQRAYLEGKCVRRGEVEESEYQPWQIGGREFLSSALRWPDFFIGLAFRFSSIPCVYSMADISAFNINFRHTLQVHRKQTININIAFAL